MKHFSTHNPRIVILPCGDNSWQCGS